MGSRRWAVAIALVLFLGLTNQWRSWAESITYSQAFDVQHYEKISRAAPAFPTESLSLHHAQRFAIHYLTGWVSHVTGIELSVVYRLVWALLAAALLLACDRVLARFKLTPDSRLACLSLFLLNPYTLRYYTLAFGMVQDMLFILGTFVVLLGLLDGRLSVLIAGAALAAVGRQTVVMLFPGIALWVVFGKAWQGRPLSRRLAFAAAPCAAAAGIYLGTAWTVRAFTEPSRNLEHVTAIFGWIASPAFRPGELGELLLRTAIPFALPAAVIAGLAAARGLGSVEALSCLLMTLGISAQPVLAGPVITGRNASRLSALGFAFVVALVAFAVSKAKAAQSRAAAILVIGAAGAASWHHLYTITGPATAGQFAVWQLAVASGLGLAGWWLRRGAAFANQAVF